MYATMLASNVLSGAPSGPRSLTCRRSPCSSSPRPSEGGFSIPIASCYVQRSRCRTPRTRVVPPPPSADGSGLRMRTSTSTSASVRPELRTTRREICTLILALRPSPLYFPVYLQKLTDLAAVSSECLCTRPRQRFSTDGNTNASKSDSLSVQSRRLIPACRNADDQRRNVDHAGGSRIGRGRGLRRLGR